MMKRSMFLSLAAGVLASLAFAMPSNAGSVTVETSVEFTVPSPGTASNVEITYSDYGTITGPIVFNVPGTSVHVTSSMLSTDEATIHFTAIGGTQTIDFTFTATDAAIQASPSLSGVTGVPKGQFATIGVALTVSAVPEPTSMALLGIGMTGFLAFRKLFKRGAVA
jgi:hypothetical protein